VIGPGLGLSDAARRVVEGVALGFAGPVVLDADAITHFAGRAGELSGAPGPRLLTPHPGELGRLLGCASADVVADRFAALARAVSESGHTVLLKGPHTLIGAPGEPLWVSSAGHRALATGGSGDVLSGVCAALCVHLPPRQAAALAEELHGRAACAWSEARGGVDRGLLAREIAEGLPAARAALAELAGRLPE
jgi:NAD(P)H-hydrate epimerase